MSLWRLEILRLFRTHRLWILLAVFTSFGVLGPVTARFLPEIVAAVGGGVEISVPPPSPELAMAGYLGNALQIGILAITFVAAAALAFDAKPEMAVYLRTRATIQRILAPRYAVNMVVGHRVVRHRYGGRVCRHGAPHRRTKARRNTRRLDASCGVPRIRGCPDGIGCVARP